LASLSTPNFAGEWSERLCGKIYEGNGNEEYGKTIYCCDEGNEMESTDTEWLKANWDASNEKNRNGVEDEKGEVIVAQCKSIVEALDPNVVEARATLMAIQMCREHGFTKVQFEGDAQIVVNVVNANDVD
jgi:hypothetical protein